MKKLLALASALAWSTATAAPLTLDDVIRASDAYPLLEAATDDVAIARGDALSAEGAFDASWRTRGTVMPIGYYDSLRVESVIEKPTSMWGITPFVGYRLGVGDFAIYDGKAQTLGGGEVRAGVIVPLWRDREIDRRRASLARAELGVEISQLTLAEQRLQLRRLAAYRYWAWVASVAKLRIAERLLANATDRDAGLGARVTSGDIPSIERVDNARAIQARRAQVEQARRSVEQAAIELSLFVRDANGRPRIVDLADAPALGDPAVTLRDLAADLADAVARRPEAARLARQALQSDIEVSWADNQISPRLDFQAVASRDLGAKNPMRPDLGYSEVELGLVVEIPLQTNVAEGRMAASRAAASRARKLESFARDRISAEVRDARSGVERAVARLAASRSEVELARQVEAGERTRFEQGDATILTVNIREQQTVEAEVRVVDALLDLQRSLIDLRTARGDL